MNDRKITYWHHYLAILLNMTKLGTGKNFRFGYREGMCLCGFFLSYFRISQMLISPFQHLLLLIRLKLG